MPLLPRAGATPTFIRRDRLPARAGVGLKAEHVADLLALTPNVGFLEIHAENYLGAGGPPHAHLTALRETYSLSIHGVGLSIGGTGPIDEGHLSRLADLTTRYDPEAFSGTSRVVLARGRLFQRPSARGL